MEEGGADYAFSMKVFESSKLDRWAGRVDSQDSKLSWYRPQDWEQGKAEDKAGQGSQIARPKDEQSIPPAH